MEPHETSPHSASRRNVAADDWNPATSPTSPVSDLLSPLSISSKRSWYKSYFMDQRSSDAGDDDLASPITLEDHTEGEHEHNSGLWAKAVSIDSYSVVGSSIVGGSYVVWNCTVETLEGGPMRIRKRYSEFDHLRQALIQTFPNAEVALPPLPRKSVVSRFRPRFLEQRRQGLIYFLNCVLLNPEFAGSPVLKHFLFY